MFINQLTRNIISKQIKMVNNQQQMQICFVVINIYSSTKQQKNKMYVGLIR